jgi:hypothetical protein
MTHISKFLRSSACPSNAEHVGAYSFQYGFNVRLMTEVVCICSPSTETIANGSGTRRISRLISESAATTDSDSRIGVE